MINNPFHTKNNNSTGQQPHKSFYDFFMILSIIIIVGLFYQNFIANNAPASINLPYNTFISYIKANDIKNISSTGSSITGVFVHETGLTSKSKNKVKDFTTEVPSFAGGQLETLLSEHKVVINAQNPSPPTSIFSLLLFDFGPIILFALLFLWFMNKSKGGAGGFGIGKSKARLYDSTMPSVSFDDVAGIDEAKQELSEIVDFLREPSKYQKLGGVAPRGVLLVGLPGTGKTLLAKAVAGEAKVPFFSISASEFIEMIVGVGASRVRDLFEKAKAQAPAIIFIDELDAIGRSRSNGPSFGGHDEREQTLNQILTEMDGFSPREGVIVLAATNRSDVLDQALLRPGRFDRQVIVHPPDKVGRAAIFKIHTRSTPLDDDVDLNNLAAKTPGLVGADIKNLVNEAALLAAKLEQDTITTANFGEALEKVLLGAARNLVPSEEDRKRTAYHEAGHALLGLLLPGADPVRRVSIIPRGRSLGATMQTPDFDRQNYSEEYLEAKITGALGGRAAEKVVFDNITTGAESDLQQVTRIAYQMVVHWGMSEAVGNLNFDLEDNNSFIQGKPYSEATAELIDKEVKRIVDRCFKQAITILTDNREKLNALTDRLLTKETLDENEILEVTGLIKQNPLP